MAADCKVKDLAGVGHIVGRGLGKDDDVVQIDEGVLTVEGAEDNVDFSLRRSLCCF